MKNALSRTVRVFAFLIFTSATLLTQSVVAQKQPPIQVGENIRSIIFDSLTREYLLYIPKGYDLKTPLPLVLLFHGMGMNATQIMNMSGFGKAADEKHFIIAAPNYEKGALKNDALTYDIVNFSKDFIREISSIVAIDKKRIYAAGYSRGGRICSRLASELSTDIAAAGIVGGLFFPMKSPLRAVSIIAFHGTEDKVVRYGQTESVLPHWVENNECKGTPVRRKISEDVTQTIYGSCKDNSEVLFFRVNKSGHTWPGGPRADSLEEKGLGKTNKDINATNLIWSFFEAHPLP
jgi:polyhydroxybutyrate depolymerase